MNKNQTMSKHSCMMLFGICTAAAKLLTHASARLDLKVYDGDKTLELAKCHQHGDYVKGLKVGKVCTRFCVI